MDVFMTVDQTLTTMETIILFQGVRFLRIPAYGLSELPPAAVEQLLLSFSICASTQIQYTCLPPIWSATKPGQLPETSEMITLAQSLLPLIPRFGAARRCMVFESRLVVAVDGLGFIIYGSPAIPMLPGAGQDQPIPTMTGTAC